MGCISQRRRIHRAAEACSLVETLLHRRVNTHRRGAVCRELTPPTRARDQAALQEEGLDDIFERMDQILENVEGWMTGKRSHA